MRSGFRRDRAWSGAASVMVITTALVVLDLVDGGVHRYLSRHAFTSSVLSGLLVLLLTVLIVDRVARRRQLKNKSRAVGAQAAIITAQASRAADAIGRSSGSDEGREEAAGELRTYTQMLLVSAPVLIDASVQRTFLETAQRLAADLYRALQSTGRAGPEQTKKDLEREVTQLRTAAAPLIGALDYAQRAAVSSDDEDAGASA